MDKPPQNYSNRLKRLRFRSWHRGCKETDLLFGPFSDSGLATLTDTQLDVYENMLEEHDADVWAWVTGKTPPPADGLYDELLELLKKHRKIPSKA